MINVLILHNSHLRSFFRIKAQMLLISFWKSPWLIRLTVLIFLCLYIEEKRWKNMKVRGGFLGLVAVSSIK